MSTCSRLGLEPLTAKKKDCEVARAFFFLLSFYPFGFTCFCFLYAPRNNWAIGFPLSIQMGPWIWRAILTGGSQEPNPPETRYAFLYVSERESNDWTQCQIRAITSFGGRSHALLCSSCHLRSFPSQTRTHIVFCFQSPHLFVSFPLFLSCPIH